MDNNSINQKDFPEKPQDSEVILDVTPLSFEQIVQVTQPEVAELASTLIDVLRSSDKVDAEQLRELWIEYARRVEAFVDSMEDPEARSKAQIAAIVSKAMIFRRVGNITRYLEELDSAQYYATFEGFSTVATFLDAEIGNKVELLDLSPEKAVLLLRGIISDSNREFLRDLIYDGDGLNDVIGHAYGMILEEGEDPDEVLARLGITE